MNEKYEDLLEQLNLVYRLKEQAEQQQHQSDLMLKGMRAVLEAKSSSDLYQRMFDMFASIVPYELAFILEPDEPGFMRCTSSTLSLLQNIQWEVDSVLKKVATGSPTAIFDARRQPSAKQAFDQIEPDVKAIMYCPLQTPDKEAIIVFGHSQLGYYTQEHVALLERFRAYTTQTFLSVDARLQAMESEQLRRDKERAEASLLQTEKMASIGLLAAGVAHEINNPIGFVSSNISFLKEQVPQLQTLTTKLEALKADSNDGLAEFINWYQENNIADMVEELSAICEESEDGINRVTNIVTSLKSFTHTNEQNATRTLNVNQCIQDTLVLVSPELKHKANLNVELHETPNVLGDSHKLGQVLINLLVNAGHAITRSGEISIRTHFNSAIDRVIIEVEDNGKGISSQALDKIFDPFFTTKKLGEGTGLGLYISFSIIEAMDGELSVKSKVNVGTCFTICLPKAQLR